MGLFTTPLVINDGTADRTFDFLYQTPGDLLGSVYNEPAGSSINQSKLSAQHTTAKSGRERHMLQSSEEVDLVNPGADDPSIDSIVINLSVAHHPLHAATDVEKRVLLLLAAAGITGITAKLMQKSI